MEAGENMGFMGRHEIHYRSHLPFPCYRIIGNAPTSRFSGLLNHGGPNEPHWCYFPLATFSDQAKHLR